MKSAGSGRTVRAAKSRSIGAVGLMVATLSTMVLIVVLSSGAKASPPPWTITVKVSSSGWGSVTSSPGPSYYVSGGPPPCTGICTWGYGTSSSTPTPAKATTTTTTTTTTTQPGKSTTTAPSPVKSPTTVPPTPTTVPPVPTTSPPTTTPPPPVTTTTYNPPPSINPGPPAGAIGGGFRPAVVTDAAYAPPPVTLSETAKAGYVFVSWTVGDLVSTTANCGTASSCTVTFDSRTSGSVDVTATFKATAPTSTVAPASTASAPRDLTVIPVSVEPGGPATAVGRGCPGRVPVLFTIHGTHVGTTTSATDGDFEGPVDTTDLAVGTYEVDAHCGLLLSAPLDIVLASQVNSDTGSIVVIIFFLLLGIVLFARQLRFR